jgi:ABC-2 type transport system permease protein
MNPTIARLSAQALFGQKRGILLAVLPALLVLLSVVTGSLIDGSQAIEPVTIVFGLALVLPLIALLVANGVLGPEIEDGSIVYLLSKPVSRYVVVASKYLVAAAVCVLLGAGSVLVSAVVLEPGELTQALAIGLGAVAASLAYCGLFLALATLTRHGTIAGLIYILGFEVLLAPWLPGLRYISVVELSRRLIGVVDDQLSLVGQQISLAYALVAVTVLVVGGVLLAGYRLRSFELTGEE